MMVQIISDLYQRSIIIKLIWRNSGNKHSVIPARKIWVRSTVIHNRWLLFCLIKENSQTMAVVYVQRHSNSRYLYRDGWTCQQG